MYLEIITPIRVVFSGEVDRVQIPGVKGSFELLNNHAPIISNMVEGRIRVITGEDPPRYFSVMGGIAECKSNKIIILSEKASETDQI